MSATFKLHLLRSGTPKGSLPSFDKTMAVERPVFTRPSFVGTINDIKVIYALRDVAGIGEPMGIYSVGYNNRGQLALGDNENRNEFTLIDLESWLMVESGVYHTAAIKGDGTLWVSGRNTYGALGLGDYGDRNVLTQVGSDTDWAYVKCQDYSTVAIKTNGTLWSTGYNYYGGLGLGDKIQTNTFQQEVGLDTDWSFVVGGAYHVVAIKTNGEMWGVGRCYDGELGLGSRINVTEYTQIDTGNWSKIACGAWHTMAIKSDGSLWFTGVTNLGQSGLGPGVIPGQRLLVLTQVGSGADYADVSCGQVESYIVKANGTLWGTGENYSGQLGVGDEILRDVFVQEVGLDTDWSRVFGGWGSIFALKSDNTLYSAGGNYAGTLGLGDYDDRNVFTKVGEWVWEYVSIHGAGHRIAIRK